MNVRTSLLTPLLGIVATLPGFAREWTYRECVDYARVHNISLQQLRLAEETSAYSLEAAKAQWQPSVDFATTQGFTNTPWSDGNSNAYTGNYGLNASWTVWNGGERENTIKRSRLQTSIDSLSTADMMRSIETDLLTVYINILYAGEAIAIYDDAVKLSYAQAERARQMMEAGRLSRVDYAQLQAQYEQDRYALVNAQGTYDSRRMELKRLLELGIDDEITPSAVEWTSQQLMAPLPPIEESYRLALATDSRLRAAELAVEEADIDVAIAKAGSRPRIALTAGVGAGYFAPGGASFGTQLKRSVNESVGLTLSIPILDNKKTKVAVAKANVQRLNSALEQESRQNEIARLVETCYIDLRAAQSRFTAGEEQVKAAELSNDLVNEQYSLGLVNTVELLTAHNSLLEARHSLLQAKYMALLQSKMIEFYRTATIDL